MNVRFLGAVKLRVWQDPRLEGIPQLRPRFPGVASGSVSVRQRELSSPVIGARCSPGVPRVGQDSKTAKTADSDDSPSVFASLFRLQGSGGSSLPGHGADWSCTQIAKMLRKW